MERMSSHDDLDELLGAYALDAVEPDEAELLDRHLESCPRCRAEVREHRETAALLGYIGAPAPLGLWDQIVAGAQEPPPELRIEARVLPRRPHRRQRSLRVRTVAIAGGIAAAIVAVLGVQVGRLDNRTNDLNQRLLTLSPQAPSMATVQAALATPGNRQVHLASLVRTKVSANAVVLPDGNGYLYGAQMDPLAPDRTYQLWGVDGDQRISYGPLGTNPTMVVAFRAGPGVQALAMTNEVAGGVEHSTQPLVVVGRVNAERVGPFAEKPKA